MEYMTFTTTLWVSQFVHTILLKVMYYSIGSPSHIILVCAGIDTYYSTACETANIEYG